MNGFVARLVMTAGLIVLLSAMMPAATTVMDSIDTYLDDAIPALGAPGGAFLLLRDGRTVYQRSWGTTSGGDRVTADTPFLLGSVSKPVTAYAVLRLIEAGELRLDTSVRDRVPWFTLGDSAAASSITIEHLLTHTSGLSTAAGLRIADRGAVGPAAVRRTVELLADEVPVAPAGERYIYSSANYAVLGAVIEAVSGTRYSEFMEAEVFRQLGMKNAAADRRRAVARGWQPGYRSWFGFSMESRLPYDDGGAPYGYLAASATDVARFASALGGADGPAGISLEQMLRPRAEAGKGLHYALGWRLYEFEEGGRRVWHSGSTPDHRAELVLLPDAGWSFVVLSNRNNTLEEGRMAILARDVVDILRGKQVPAVDYPAHPARVIMLGVLAVLGAGLLVLGFRVQAHQGEAIRRGRWLALAVTLGILAAATIPGLLRGAAVGWHTLSLFAPDLATTAVMATGLLAAAAVVAGAMAARGRNT